MHRCACAGGRDRGETADPLRMQIHPITGGAGSLAREQLKWQPTVSLEQGLNLMIESFRKVVRLLDQPEA